MNSTTLSPQPVTPTAEKVPLRVRIGWGFGGLADNYIINTINTLGLVIYVTYFKLDPTLAGIAMFIPRFVDAFFDPIFGHISDKTRSRWGRRRPYMAVGVILCAILLPLLWTPPFVATASAPWHANGPFLYFSAIGVLYALAYSLFVVPYTALGYELTNDYDERTRVLAWRMYIGLAGSMSVPWLYRLCLLHVFPNEAVGARWISVGLSVLIIITGMLPVLICREREDVQHQESINMIEAVRQTFTNKPFLILSVAYIVIFIGFFSSCNLFTFVNIYYVCHGDKGLAGQLTGLIGFIASLTAYGSMFLVAAVSAHTSKRRAMNLGLMFALVGTLAYFVTLSPRWPHMQLISVVIWAMGLQGAFLMTNSMIADICDEDELKTGMRREGMFGAVNGFCQKFAMALTSLIGGFLLRFAGLNPNTADAGVSASTASTLKLLTIGIQASGFLIAILVFLFYPITRERAAQTRRQLEERHRQRRQLQEEPADTICVTHS